MVVSNPRHFLSLSDWSREEVEGMLARAAELKALRGRGVRTESLAGRSILLYFEHPSLRTHVSFEIGIAELGATSVVLPPEQVRIGEREAVEDVARVLSCWCHALVARTHSHRLVEDLARSARVPVVNALTDRAHPCQALADALTMREAGGLREGRLVWVGVGNNMTHSLIALAGALGLRLTVSTPEACRPDPELMQAGTERARREGGEILYEPDPRLAVRDAAFIYTDVWVSMGEEGRVQDRHRVLAPYQVNADLVDRAPPDVKILHCGPAHRGEEVSADVIDGKRSLFYEQAENRLHAQKAILESVIGVS
ncbi:MAG: ornithine carbamoyltransferase [Myxococcales bacterium]|nr:ornithine carbamoyltransferase [Myxococcales bacterium]